MTDLPNAANLWRDTERVVEVYDFDPEIFVRESEEQGYELVARIMDSQEDGISEYFPIGSREIKRDQPEFQSTAICGWLRSDPEGIDKLWRHLLETERWQYYNTAKGIVTSPRLSDNSLGGWH